MVLMAILGGKGTLWGPVVGAVVFHVTQEFFWSTLLGWQRVAMGLLIVVVVVFFPLGITYTSYGLARAALLGFVERGEAEEGEGNERRHIPFVIRNKKKRISNSES